MSRFPQYLHTHIQPLRINRAGAAMLAAALLAGGASIKPAAAQETEFAYVASATTNRIEAYRVDKTTGALTPLGGPHVTAGQDGASAVAIEQRGGFLYVAKGADADNDVAGFQIDRSSGRLSAIPGSPFQAGTTPSAVVAAPSGRFLYVANSGSNNISGFKINEGSGRLMPLSGSPFAAGNSPDALVIDPAGKYLYAANGADGNISGYAIDSSTGALTPIAGSPFTTGTDPLTLAVDPTGTYVYAGGGDGKVYTYLINGPAGALASLPGSPVNAGDGAVNWVSVDPNNQFVYAAGAGGIYTYSIRLLSNCFPCVSPGTLTYVSVTPPGTGTTPGESEWTPTGFVQDYTGRFAYAPDGSSATTASGFTVSSGSFTAIAGSPFSDSKGVGPMAITRPFIYPVFSAEQVPLTAFEPVKTVVATAINNLGHVTGTVTAAGGEILDFPFLFNGDQTGSGGGFGNHTAFAYALNDKDQVVGTAATSVPVGTFPVLSEAYLYSAGGTTINLDGRSGGVSAAYGINNSGLVTGSWSTGTCQVEYNLGCGSLDGLGDTHAFLYNGQMNDLGTLGGNFSEGRGINGHGVIVGGSNTVASGPNHLFRYQGGKMFDLGMMRGQPTEGTAVNNRGQIIGTGAGGFLFSNGHYQAIPPLPGGTYMTPQGIDDYGIVAGTCDVPGGGPTHACVYAARRVWDLNLFVSPGQNLLTSAPGINNSGQIVAQGLDGQVYVLTPGIGHRFE